MDEKNECLKKCLNDTKCRYLTIKDNVCYYRAENYNNETKKNICPMNEIHDCYIFESIINYI